MSKYSRDVVKILYEHRSKYISGQYITDQLNIPRAAVKKVIDQLKADGCDIDSISHKGHKLNASPNRWYRGTISKVLKSNHLVSKIEVYDSAGSTQTIAKQGLVDNRHTMLILNNGQIKGRGRFDRNWSFSRGRGLWTSVVLKPNVSFTMVPKFNFFIALEIRDAIQTLSRDEVEIKWPDDIYINDKKICGFLTEIVANADAIEAIICGIGINLNHQEEDFSDMIHHRATSIRLHHSEEINRYQFLKRLIGGIEKRCHQSLNSSFEATRDEYIRTSNIWHRKLTFTEDGEQFIGEAIDVNNDDFLIVKDEDNQTRRLIDADIDI